MATISNITSDVYISLNTETGIPVGSAMKLQLKSVTWLNVIQSDTQPLVDSPDGIELTNLSYDSSRATVIEGGKEVWVKAVVGGRTGVLEVQGIDSGETIIVGEHTKGVSSEPVSVTLNDSPPLNVPFLKDRVTTTLAVDAVIGAYSITASPGHGLLVGDTLEVADLNVFEFFQAKILSILGDVITIDQPIPYPFATATSIVLGSSDSLLVDGSVTPEVFSVIPLPTQKAVITRLIIEIRGTDFMDFETLGSDASVLRGCQIRIKRSDGTFKNLINFKNNGDFIRQSFDYDFQQNTGNNVRSFVARITWGGNSKQGTVINLDGSLGEELQVLVQDDLTGTSNNQFILQAQGNEMGG